MKAGGEYLFMHELHAQLPQLHGPDRRAQRGPSPRRCMQAIFPDPFNADTWNLNALAPYTRRFTLGISETFRTPFDVPQNGGVGAGRLARRGQPDAQSRPALRPDHRTRGRTTPTCRRSSKPDGRTTPNNIQPRLGFAYQVNDRTVVRGGAGRYYGDVLTQPADVDLRQRDDCVGRSQQRRPSRFRRRTRSTGRRPTPAQAFANFCDVSNNRPGCLTRGLQELAPPPHTTRSRTAGRPRSASSARSVIVIASRRTTSTTAAATRRSSRTTSTCRYNPATGVQLPYSVPATRPYPLLGIISVTPYTGWSDYHGLQSAVTKRFSNNWQGRVTYTAGPV